MDGAPSSVLAPNSNTIRNIFKLPIPKLKIESSNVLNFGRVNFSSLRIKNTICMFLDYFSYGTFWIYTTIVFCISAVQNIIRYQSQAEFSFNFDIIGAAFGFFFVVGFGFPVGLSFLMNCLGI